jgi:hypothetical protein
MSFEASRLRFLHNPNKEVKEYLFPPNGKSLFLHLLHPIPENGVNSGV